MQSECLMYQRHQHLLLVAPDVGFPQKFGYHGLTKDTVKHANEDSDSNRLSEVPQVPLKKNFRGLL